MDILTQKRWDQVFNNTVKQHEKIISNQKFNSFLCDLENGSSYEKVLTDLIISNSKLKFPKEEFICSEDHEINELASSPVSLDFICFLLSLIRPKLVIEIGSFVGYATCNMAAKLAEGGKLITIEKYDKFASIAQQNIDKFGLSNCVEIKLGDAKDVLNVMNLKDKKVDFAFIDGNKEDYLTYVKWFLANLSMTGCIIVDDIFFHGDALNEKCNTDKGAGAKSVIEYLGNQNNLSHSFLPIANGLLLVKKQ